MILLEFKLVAFNVSVFDEDGELVGDASEFPEEISMICLTARVPVVTTTADACFDVVATYGDLARGDVMRSAQPLAQSEGAQYACQLASV